LEKTAAVDAMIDITIVNVALTRISRQPARQATKLGVSKVHEGQHRHIPMTGWFQRESAQTILDGSMIYSQRERVGGLAWN